MSVFACSPFEIVRTAIMTLVAPRRTKCLVASRPRPRLAPVTRTILPSNEVSGQAGVKRSCDRRNLRGNAMLKESDSWLRPRYLDAARRCDRSAKVSKVKSVGQ